MKAYIDHITALIFKLRIFGVPVLDYTKILCYNNCVVNNSFIFVSTLNKKHISIVYHYVRWNMDAQVVKVAWINTNCNPADAFMNRLTYDKRDRLFGDWTC